MRIGGNKVTISSNQKVSDCYARIHLHDVRI